MPLKKHKAADIEKEPRLPRLLFSVVYGFLVFVLLSPLVLVL
jgi:hypothetical protein